MLPWAFQIEVDGPLIQSRGRYGAAEAQSASPADGRMRERVHASTCLAVVTSGSFEFRTPSGEAVATAGSMIFGQAGEAFSFRYLGGQVARRAVIALSEDLLADVADYCGTDSHRFPVAAISPRRSTTALYGTARRIAMTEKDLEEDVFEVVAAAFTIGREVRPRRCTPRARTRLLEVARYIDREYARPLRLDALSAMAQLSKFHFLRAFAVEIGESPGRYLVAARLRAAADRLISSSEPIASIALNVGFNDLSHFNATFRTTFGTTPSEWRKSARS